MLWVSPALTVYICVLTGILGACMGSFLNCMAWRIVHGESVLHGRSHCDVCGHVLGAGDLIPVLSYIMHKGRCKYCGAKLSAGHVFAEVLTALTFLLLVLKYDISLQALEYILLACLLLAAAFTDLEGYMIPDRFIVTGIVVRVVFLFLQGNVLENLMDALLGGFAVVFFGGEDVSAQDICVGEFAIYTECVGGVFFSLGVVFVIEVCPSCQYIKFRVLFFFFWRGVL